MTKSPTTTKRGRPLLPETQQKTKVQFYLRTEIVDFIKGLVEQGDAYSITSFCALAIQNYVNRYRESMQETAKSQAKNQKKSKKVEKNLKK